MMNAIQVTSLIAGALLAGMFMTFMAIFVAAVIRQNGGPTPWSVLIAAWWCGSGAAAVIMIATHTIILAR